MSAPYSFRRGAGLATSAVLLALLSLTPAMPVSALDQAANTIRVTENQTVEKDFPPLASAEPLPGLPSPAPRLNTPDRCRQATYCDTIPLEVVLPPTLKPSDEFFVSVALEWKTQSLPATAYTKPQQLNDLDLYVWEDPQTDMPIQQSSTDAQPEQLRLFRPGKSKYSIVVFNYLGANTGYKLRVTYKPEKIVPPFESLAPDFNPVATPPVPFVAPVDDSQPPAVLPIDTSGQAETPTTAPAPPPEAKPAPLTPVVVNPDPDFTNFADDAFDQQLAAPTSDVLTEKQVKAVGPPKPASTSSLIFWLAIVPLLLAAAGGFWLSRKGSAVLRMR
ncbi:MAG TPA: hypothetical protein VGF00_07005 [Acidimicrobiia bacterium]